MRSPLPVALTIAGFDPSSGAGLTADLKTFAAHNVYGISCTTALTVQSTQGVRRVVAVEPGLVEETLACLAEDIEIGGIKIGMLGSASIAGVVADFLSKGNVPRERVVLDPVIRSTSGAALLDEAGVMVLRERLLGLVGWITPNLQELAALVSVAAVTRETVPEMAYRLQVSSRHAGNDQLTVIVTGGHLDRPDDYFLGVSSPGASEGKPANGTWIEGEKIETTSTHGTGCAFSSALLCQVLAGHDREEAVFAAKRYVTDALRYAQPLGKGHGPMNHLYTLPPQN